MAEGRMFDQPVVPRLVSLLADVRSGNLQVPEFQRSFVWGEQQRLDLMDSVSKGMPIGSFLVWRTNTKHDVRTKTRVGAFALPDGGSVEGQRYYLLDGLQRLITLYSALMGGAVGDTAPNDGSIWPIYYELGSTDTFRFRLPIRRRGWTAPLRWLPLDVVFYPARLYRHQKELLNAGEPDDLLEEAERLSSRFKDYQIPVIPIVSDDLRLVAESFKRVNSAGTRMSEVDMVRALTFTQDFDLERRFDQIAERLGPLGWGELDRPILLNCLKARWGLDVYTADPGKIREELERDEAALDDLEMHLETVVGFLRDRCAVRGANALPYAYQLVALTEAARREGADAFRKASPVLRQWFFQTTYSGYFTGITGNRIRRAIDHVQRLVDGSQDDTSPDDLNDEVRPLLRFRMPSVRTQAFVLMMANAAQSDEELARVYAALGTGALHRLLPDAPADDPANRVLAAPETLGQLRAALDRPLDEQGAALLYRHLVPEEAAMALQRGDQTEFLRLRKRHHDLLEAEWVGELGLTWSASSDGADE